MAPQSFPRRTILLVEDDPFVCDATSRILRHAGFEVLPAADAQEALQLFDQAGRKVDLVMTDVVLPGRSGPQLVQDLQLPTPGTPVLLTSGYGEAGDVSESAQPGTHYLSKPYGRQSLVEKVEQIFAATPVAAAARVV